MSWNESLCYTDQLTGVHPWTGYTVDVVALQWTLKEAHQYIQVAREFTHERTKQQITHLNAIASAPVQKPRPAMPKRSSRGEAWLGKWTDFSYRNNFFQIIEPAFTHCPALLGACPETPNQEQYYSAWEDTDEDEGDTTSVLDAELNASMGKEMDTSGHLGCSASADRCHWRNHALWREYNWALWEFGKPKNWRLSFPLFREMTKEDAISYRDWHSKVEEAFERGYDAAKVKEAMFLSLEGMAKDNTKMTDENCNLHVTEILDGLDSLYGVSVTFQSLNSALCGLQQKPFKATHTYYNRMAQIMVILREHHGNQYQPGELACMSKDCFYMGASSWELSNGSPPERPASHHSLGPIEGIVGAGRKWCSDMHRLPLVNVC